MKNEHYSITRIKNGRSETVDEPVVREFPLRLTVNGRELATLIGSPHQLNYLAAGFLRLQGFIDSLDDIASLGVCAEFGAAQVRLNRKELPERLRPVLTSGCGTGITFAAPDEALRPVVGSRRYPAAEITALMNELARRADQYRSHGGIHSAAVGEGGNLLLFAEDLGRHNTLDRIAGEALFKGIDLRGRMLVTSGRVSTEMAAKAARLGVGLIASRTSPTDMAVRLCREAGIVLIGYLRGESFDIYTHPERVAMPAAASASLVPAAVPRPLAASLQEVTGVILAGGESRRMGSNKALLPHRGGRFIETVYRELAGLFAEVIVVTNEPELYKFLPCRKVPDLFPGTGVLAGVHAGLRNSATPRIFVVACDMPRLNSRLIRHLAEAGGDWDVVIPESPAGLEPLHALYHRRCLPAMEGTLAAGQKRIVDFFQAVQVKQVSREEVAQFDPAFDSFRNINTPEEYFGLRGGETPTEGEEKRRLA